MPLSVYLIIRNCTETLRKHYLYLFAYMGRITLETYIFQFHIWMRTTGLNGSPKKLLVLVDSYWLNFVILTAIYLFISLRFSQLTGVLRDALIRDNLRAMGKVMCVLAAFGLLCWILSLWWTRSLCLECENKRPYVPWIEQTVAQFTRCCHLLASPLKANSTAEARHFPSRPSPSAEQRCTEGTIGVALLGVSLLCIIESPVAL